MSEPVSDIRTESWPMRTASPALRPYLTLMRLDRPIGTWLLLYPCWWGLAMAPSDMALRDYLWRGILFGIACVLLRGIACTVNDIFDRDLDAQVARTRTRPLPSGAVTPGQAWAFLVLQIAVVLPMLLAFSLTTVLLALAAVVGFFIYPLMKRITYWPQAFLGIVFNWGVPGGWAAAAGNPGMAAWLLYAAGFFWTLGYDTIYALQDVEDDTRTGIKSTARLFGEWVRVWVGAFYVMTMVLAVCAERALQFDGPVTLAFTAAAALHLVWQVATLKTDTPRDCLAKFRSNRFFGLLMLLALAAGQAAI
ncbi:4-hydroxybenzoate octaprenyltransferase [Bordetella genomosp. 13]|uniref:4-hydroxybenzoate octaprenyltransferase n=1 Tax=Bordetella genomosp. 13 TaxID=463040 RepID=UPI0011A38AE3|nr:4-hydroxybenzoate octaprenyltransferase [Bordetella genomosp. 13]